MGAEYRALSHCRQGYEMTRVTPAAETEKYRRMLSSLYSGHIFFKKWISTNVCFCGLRVNNNKNIS